MRCMKLSCNNCNRKYLRYQAIRIIIGQIIKIENDFMEQRFTCAQPREFYDYVKPIKVVPCNFKAIKDILTSNLGPDLSEMPRLFWGVEGGIGLGWRWGSFSVVFVCRVGEGIRMDEGIKMEVGRGIGMEEVEVVLEK
ncbi:hypothetical protein CsSME_00006174 [Camellia sinensis var. sinensis]